MPNITTGGKEFTPIPFKPHLTFDTGTSGADVSTFTATNPNTTGMIDGLWGVSPLFSHLSNCPPITQPKEKKMDRSKIVRKLIREIIQDPAKEALIERYYNMGADTLFYAKLDPEKLYETALALETGSLDGKRKEEE